MTATVLCLLFSPICKAALLAMVVCSVGAFVPDRAVKRRQETRRRSADASNPREAKRDEFDPNCEAGRRRGDGVSNVYEWEMVSVNS